MRLLILAISLVALQTSAEIPRAYQLYAQKHQVPADLLLAVCSQESGRSVGRRLLPWPWTLNVAGRGAWYDTAQDAQRALDRALARSCRVDIGLCQVHWCAHRHRFASAVELLNPYVNLDYAASILRAEYDRVANSGTSDVATWWQAVGRYHAPNRPQLAQRYRKRVHERWVAQTRTRTQTQHKEQS